MPNEIEDRIKLAEIGKDVGYLKEIGNLTRTEIEAVRKLLTDQYVTRLEFDPVKRAVFFVIGTIALAVIGAGLSFLLQGRYIP